MSTLETQAPLKLTPTPGLGLQRLPIYTASSKSPAASSRTEALGKVETQVCKMPSVSSKDMLTGHSLPGSSLSALENINSCELEFCLLYPTTVSLGLGRMPCEQYAFKKQMLTDAERMEQGLMEVGTKSFHPATFHHLLPSVVSMDSKEHTCGGLLPSSSSSSQKANWFLDACL